MKELISARKIKINLSDYEYEKDINNRLLMSEFSDLDREILEEILYNSVKIPIKNLSLDLNIDEKQVRKSLNKLSKTGLLEIQSDFIVVDKQLRKYFEFQILKFDNSFKPDMEYLLTILKKVPINILPAWYSIPKTSNNIFESIIEKYLLTPHHYQRFLEDFQLKDKILKSIIEDVFSSKDYQMFAEEIKLKYQLSDIEFEKCMLTLEYNFALCLTYQNIDGYWKETVRPFHEWQEYLKFQSETLPSSIIDEKNLKRIHKSDFVFIEHIQSILENIDQQKLLLNKNNPFQISEKLFSEKILDFDDTFILTLDSIYSSKTEYVREVIEKLFTLFFLKSSSNGIILTPEGKNWLSLTKEKKALALYQHPLNCLSKEKYSDEIFSISNIRRAEKSIIRVLNSSWIHLEDFLKGVMIPITDEQFITLKKEGKSWGYILPKYTEKQLNLIKIVVLKWLFESSMVTLGILNDKICFKVTDFGKSVFEI